MSRAHSERSLDSRVSDYILHCRQAELDRDVEARYNRYDYLRGQFEMPRQVEEQRVTGPTQTEQVVNETTVPAAGPANSTNSLATSPQPAPPTSQSSSTTDHEHRSVSHSEHSRRLKRLVLLSESPSRRHVSSRSRSRSTRCCTTMLLCYAPPTRCLLSRQ